MNIIQTIRTDNLSDREFVEKCEAEFDLKLEAVSNKLLSELEVGGGRIISLTGPTCAGKTTVAKKLTRNFSELGKRVITISIDDYYLDQFVNRSHRSERIDMESVKNIDIDELIKTVQAIDGNRTIIMPVFDFKLGMRSGFREVETNKDCIFLFEGIQALYPEIYSILRTDERSSLFVCPDSCIDTGNYIIYPNELRLMRRIVRDEYFRGSSPEFTIAVWQSVRDNEEKNIFPYAKSIGLHIDTTMGYEPGIIVSRLDYLLGTIPCDSTAFGIAQKLSDAVKNIKPVSPEYLSDSSLYREFIKKEVKNDNSV